MKPAELSSAPKVIDFIGGLRLQAITGATSQSVSNWRRDGRFPPRYLFVICAELARLGRSAPLDLWGIDVPRRLKPIVAIGFAAWVRFAASEPNDMRRAS